MAALKRGITTLDRGMAVGTKGDKIVKAIVLAYAPWNNMVCGKPVRGAAQPAMFVSLYNGGARSLPRLCPKSTVSRVLVAAKRSSARLRTIYSSLCLAVLKIISACATFRRYNWHSFSANSVPRGIGASDRAKPSGVMPKSGWRRAKYVTASFAHARWLAHPVVFHLALFRTKNATSVLALGNRCPALLAMHIWKRVRAQVAFLRAIETVSRSAMAKLSSAYFARRYNWHASPPVGYGNYSMEYAQ